MPTGECPPRPRLSLNVGVTGHLQEDLIDANLDTLRERIREVLEFQREFARNLTGVEKYYTNSGKPVLRVLSALAEGADRHVANQALDLGVELQCPLPFDRSEYAKDFESESSVVEFNKLLTHTHTTAVLELDGSRDREAESYLAAGRMILSQSDVLLTVWNGQDSNKKGGTSQIVGEAKQRNLPTIWINSQVPHEVYIRISDSKWIPWAVGSGSLVIWLEVLLRPPDSPKSCDEGTTLAGGYFVEAQRTKNWGCLWLPFRNLCADGLWTPPSFSLSNFDLSGHDKWEGALRSSLAFPKETLQIMNEANLFEHYGWADGLAEYYGNLYRSAFVINYLLGPLAVLCAFLHFALEHSEALWGGVGAMCTGIEVMCLVFIGVIYSCGRKGCWHERWIDYRLLAEYFRQMFFFIPLGPGELSSPHILTHMASRDPKNTWMHWHYRTVRRDLGMICATLTDKYLEAVRVFIKSGIEDQRLYHENNALRFQMLDRRFTLLAKFLFSLALLAAFGALISHFFPAVLAKVLLWFVYVTAFSMSIPLWFTPIAWPTWVLLSELVSVVIAGVATVFPAVGAALAGIRSQGEFERVKKRSEAMRHSLEQILEKKLKDPSNVDTPISSTALSATVADSGQLMVDELLDWRIVFKDRPLPEPD